MKNKAFYILPLLFILILPGCVIIYSIAMADAINCKVKMNNISVKNDCGLTNGVRFEKLIVREKNENGIPSDFYATIRFECSHQYDSANEVRTQWPKKIYFNKKNDHYYWAMDTVSFHYIKQDNEYASRKRIFDDSIIPTFTFKDIYDTVGRVMQGDLNEYFLHGKYESEICPVKFEKDTWYYAEFFSQELSDVFIFVDKKKNFKVYTFSSGLSPF